jgi:hypothetical protein
MSRKKRAANIDKEPPQTVTTVTVYSDKNVGTTDPTGHKIFEVQ